jgi:hypothetical protein
MRSGHNNRINFDRGTYLFNLLCIRHLFPSRVMPSCPGELWLGRWAAEHRCSSGQIKLKQTHPVVAVRVMGLSANHYFAGWAKAAAGPDHVTGEFYLLPTFLVLQIFPVVGKGLCVAALANSLPPFSKRRRRVLFGRFG